MCIAIECSYKLDQKTNLNFCVNYAHFRKSGHIVIILFYRFICNTPNVSSAVSISNVSILINRTGSIEIAILDDGFRYAVSYYDVPIYVHVVWHFVNLRISYVHVLETITMCDNAKCRII